MSGFFNLLIAAKGRHVKRFVYASSSSVYGDHPALPKKESETGNVLSPYAATKAADELFADVVSRSYGVQCVGLRYFNVFGPRQDPNGPYAAVIPVWMKAALQGSPISINGDGATTRDFCYVDNAVQANIRAALAPLEPSQHLVINVAYGEETSLQTLRDLIVENIERLSSEPTTSETVYRDERAGDIRHSLADISTARNVIGYEPTHSIRDGLQETSEWFFQKEQQAQ